MSNVPQPPPFEAYTKRLRDLAEQLSPTAAPTIAKRLGSLVGHILALGSIAAAALWIAALIVLALRVLG